MSRGAAHGSRLVHGAGYVFVSLLRELDEDAERSSRSEDGEEVVDGHGDEEDPGGPLGDVGEVEGDDGAEVDEVALFHESGAGQKKTTRTPTMEKLQSRRRR